MSVSEHSDWLAGLGDITVRDKWIKHRDRVEFGKQPLEIWQFVPCKLVDGVWFFLEEPQIFKELRMKEFQQAKERCLFEGIEYIESKKEGTYSFFRIAELGVINYPHFWKNFTIEDLVKYNPKLTATAKKQI